MSRRTRLWVSPLTALAVALLVAVSIPVSIPVPASAAQAVPAVAPVAAPPRSPKPHPHRKPWPVTVAVQTVPPLAGVRLTFDATALTTDGAGRAVYTAEHNFNAHVLTLLNTSIDLPDRRYRFTRWAGQRDPGQAFRPSVSGLPMRASYTITAAFTVQYPVTARFVDGRGQPLALDRISAVKIKSDGGQLLDLPTAAPIWLDGTLPTYRKSTLVESDVSYSLQSVIVSGTNIVDAGRQKFTPAKAATVTFTGQFHDLTVRAHDALFQDSVGSQARVTLPDGTVRAVPLGPDHSATLTGLPRGTYAVSVVSGHGIVLAEQFTLSRDKALNVAVVSVVDQATIAGVALAVAAGLLVLGRARLRRYLRAAPARAVRHARRVVAACRKGAPA